jgi:hypothetical protein
MKALITAALIALSISPAAAQKPSAKQIAQFIVVPAAFGKACFMSIQDEGAITQLVAKVSYSLNIDIDYIYKLAQSDIGMMRVNAAAIGQPFPLTAADHDVAVKVGACAELKNMVGTARGN